MTPRKWLLFAVGMALTVLTDAEVRGLLEDPATWPRFAELGHEIPVSGQQTPEALAALQRADIAKWWPIIKGANVKGK
jgi:hypothetical protein